MRNDNDGAGPEHLNSIACRIEVPFSDGMGARVNPNGRVWKMDDMSVNDLLAVVDRVAESVSGRPAG